MANATQRAISRAKHQERARLELEALRAENANLRRRIQRTKDTGLEMDPSGPPVRTLSEILWEEVKLDYNDSSIPGGLKTLERAFVRYAHNSPVSLLRFYPSLTVADRKTLATMAITQLERGGTPFDTPWLRKFRLRIGAQVPAEEMQAHQERQKEERSQVLTPQQVRSQARQNRTKIAKVQREAIARCNETTNIRAGDVVLYKGSEMSVLTVSPVGAILSLEHPATGVISVRAEKVTFLRTG